jgi:hypothetical protein
MSKELDDIKRGLRVFSEQYGPAAILPAEVVAVNQAEATVHIRFSDDTEIEDARLKSVVTGDEGFYSLPAVGSIVQVARIENSEEVIVVAMSSVDKIVLKKGTDTMGKIIDDLFAEILKIYAPMNKPAIRLIQQRAQQLLK